MKFTPPLDCNCRFRSRFSLIRNATRHFLGATKEASCHASFPEVILEVHLNKELRQIFESHEKSGERFIGLAASIQMRFCITNKVDAK